MIQGLHYNDWVGREFSTLKRCVDGEPDELSDSTTESTNLIKTDFELLRDENGSLKTSIKCLEEHK